MSSRALGTGPVAYTPDIVRQAEGGGRPERGISPLQHTIRRVDPSATIVCVTLKITAMNYLEPEDVWLRFFLRRLRLGLRNAKSADTVAIFEELIADAEERLDRLELGADQRRIG